jgi:hypothetical protein
MFKASVAKRLVGSFTAVFYNVNFSFGPFTLYLGELIIIFIFEALMVGGFFAMYAFFHERKDKKKLMPLASQIVNCFLLKTSKPESGRRPTFGLSSPLGDPKRIKTRFPYQTLGAFVA